MYLHILIHKNTSYIPNNEDINKTINPLFTKQIELQKLPELCCQTQYEAQSNTVKENKLNN